MPKIFQERTENIFSKSDINNISFEYTGVGLTEKGVLGETKTSEKEQPKIDLSQLHNQSVALNF